MARNLLNVGKQFGNRFSSRNYSSASEYLINDSKYTFLRQLGLDKTNQGVYDGQWFGSGPVSFSIIIIFGIIISYKFNYLYNFMIF